MKFIAILNITRLILYPSGMSRIRDDSAYFNCSLFYSKMIHEKCSNVTLYHSHDLNYGLIVLKKRNLRNDGTFHFILSSVLILPLLIVNYHVEHSFWEMRNMYSI